MSSSEANVSDLLKACKFLDISKADIANCYNDPDPQKAKWKKLVNDQERIKVDEARQLLNNEALKEQALASGELLRKNAAENLRRLTEANKKAADQAVDPSTPENGRPPKKEPTVRRPFFGGIFGEGDPQYGWFKKNEPGKLSPMANEVLYDPFENIILTILVLLDCDEDIIYRYEDPEKDPGDITMKGVDGNKAVTLRNVHGLSLSPDGKAPLKEKLADILQAAADNNYPLPHGADKDHLETFVNEVLGTIDLRDLHAGDADYAEHKLANRVKLVHNLKDWAEKRGQLNNLASGFDLIDKEIAREQAALEQEKGAGPKISSRL